MHYQSFNLKTPSLLPSHKHYETHFSSESFRVVLDVLLRSVSLSRPVESVVDRWWCMSGGWNVV